MEIDFSIENKIVKKVEYDLMYALKEKEIMFHRSRVRALLN